MRAAASLLVVALAACGSNIKMAQTAGPATTAIGSIKLSLSNAHVVFGAHPLLVDTGTHGDLDALDLGLRKLHVDAKDIKCAVVTHVHADHAGLARALQGRGIVIIAGRGDLDRAQKGDHGQLHPTGTKGSWLKPFIPSDFMKFTPNILVDEGGSYDLGPLCGVQGQAVSMSGHTPGSLVVLIDGGKTALVGDLLRSSLTNDSQPEEHFYQDDLALAHQRIHELLARGVQTFVLGHGGPVTAEAVAKKFGRK